MLVRPVVYTLSLLLGVCCCHNQVSAVKQFILQLENGGDVCPFFSVGLLCHIPLQFLTGITGICLWNALLQDHIQTGTPASIFSTPL
jgi:hypothetical protein